MLFLTRGQTDRAVAEFERSLKVRPEADDVRLDLARALERMGRTAAARREYERLASAPDTPPDVRHAAVSALRR